MPKVDFCKSFESLFNKRLVREDVDVLSSRRQKPGQICTRVHAFKLANNPLIVDPFGL